MVNRCDDAPRDLCTVVAEEILGVVRFERHTCGQVTATRGVMLLFFEVLLSSGPDSGLLSSE